jgi:hypothetical protein
MTASIGLPIGQVANYRKTLRDNTPFRVNDFGTHYEAHLEAVHCTLDLARYVPGEGPAAHVSGAVALGALLGSAVGKSKNAVLAGAAIGGLAAILLTAISLNNETSRQGEGT